MGELEVLKDAGLTGNEARIYLSLLQYGTSTAGATTNKTGIHRRCVYDAMDRLIEKGLVGYIIRENRRYFEVSNPEHLLAILQEKEKEIISILPKLHAMYEGSEKQDVKVFKGRKGARAIYDDIIKTGEDYYALGATGKISDTIGPKTYDKYVQARVGKGIRLHAIYPESMRGSPMTKKKNAVIRYVSDEYASPINTIVYSSKVEILIWEYDPTSPLILLIDNRKVAEAFKHYFKMLWNTARK
jgi:sugar-specific transcriptional regulator TrmB